MVEVLVEHDYTAQEPDELTIKKGDIIKDVIKKSGGWWEGTLNDKKGVFPDNFVRLIDKDTVILRNKRDRIRQCRVVFSYHQDHEDELNLKVGDIIDVIGEEEEGWWRGLLNGKEGVFPSNFVEEITPVQSRPKPTTREDVRLSEDAPALPAKPTKHLCEVRFSYKAQNDDELNLKEGDVITLINKDGQDPGWWKGELNGKVGVFPDNFVILLPSSTDDKKAPSNKVDNKPAAEPSAIKPSSIASQRKSLENKTTQPKPDNKTTPPVPGKKPLISIKKSPSGSGSGLFSKLKDKIADAVDGATGSKPKTEPKENHAHENAAVSSNIFDQVERRPLLSDVRANRARAPGRRLPTSVYKEDEDEVPGLTNGNVDHQKHDHSIKSEDSFKSEASASSENLDNSSSSELDAAEVKPKLREWEKHKAPWLEEMKLNQAKRTSVSPVPSTKTPPATEPKPEHEGFKSNQTSPAEKEVNLIDMSKSMSDIKASPVDLKPVPKPFKTPPTPPNELVEKAPPIKRSTTPSKESPSKTPAPLQPVRIVPKPKTESYENVIISKQGTTSISSGVASSMTSHATSHTHTATEKASIVVGCSTTSISSSASFGSSSTTATGFNNLLSHSLGVVPDKLSSKVEECSSGVTQKQFKEVLERLSKLELKCERQANQIEELRNKLEVERDMRMMLQEKIMVNNVQV